MIEPPGHAVFPTPLDAYPVVDGGLLATLAARLHANPFNAVVTGIFALAVLHTFMAARFTTIAHDVQHRHDAARRREGLGPQPSLPAELLHFVGEVEVVFGLWAIVLLVAMTAHLGWDTAQHFFNDTVNYTEPMFVVVIMALASTRPVVGFAEAALRRVAGVGHGTPVAWWLSILTIGPVLGSFITEPAAMTICALLLARQFYDLQPSTRLKYATLGLLFVNVSIGGTLTHFAAPPILMVARHWDWDTAFVMGHFGWRSVLAILMSNAIYLVVFRRELASLARRGPAPDVERPEDNGYHAPAPGLLPVPAWLTVVHLLFMAWTVVNSHYPGLFLSGFLIFLGFAKATAVYQGRIDLKAPLLVGFFLGGLVIHGVLQGWWIGPVLASLGKEPLFFSATILTAFNDNALITYLATLVPDLSEPLKIAVVEGAVTGGGLTVIANAPNPAGQALLGRFFDGAIHPLGLFLGALLPTIVAIIAFRLL
jgi:Putative Na+/H+ antiporter